MYYKIYVYMYMYNTDNEIQSKVFVSKHNKKIKILNCVIIIINNLWSFKFIYIIF